MDKKSLEALLPLIQKSYDESLIEVHRIEGEFRLVQKLIKEWPETKELVNAEAQSSDNLRNKPSK